MFSLKLITTAKKLACAILTECFHFKTFSHKKYFLKQWFLKWPLWLTTWWTTNCDFRIYLAVFFFKCGSLVSRPQHPKPRNWVPGASLRKLTDFPKLASWETIIIKTGRGCGAVGRAVASDIRDLWFESQHWQSLLNAFICPYLSNAIHKRRSWRKREVGIVSFKQTKYIKIGRANRRQK